MVYCFFDTQEADFRRGIGIDTGAARIVVRYAMGYMCAFNVDAAI
jgi:hypothetical protein